MPFRPIALRRLLLTAACAGREAAQPRQALLDQLPGRINDFVAVPAEASPAPPAGMLARAYRAGGSEGPLIRVTVQPRPAVQGLTDTPDSLDVRAVLNAEATAMFGFAGNLPQIRAERGSDFSIGRQGGQPLLRCVDIRLLGRDSVLRNLTCATGLQGQVVRVQMVTGHRPDQLELVQRVVAEFGGKAIESLLGLPAEPAAVPPAQAPEEQQLPPELLRRLPRA